MPQRALADPPVPDRAPPRWVAPTRLRSSSVIREVFTSGSRSHGRLVVVHGRPSVDDGRVAVVAGRKVGRAVDRNRAKRRLRAALLHTGVPAGVDTVVVARPPLLRERFPALCAEVAGLLEQLSRSMPDVGRP